MRDRNYRATARMELERAGGPDVIAADLRSRIDAAADEVRLLTEQAEELRCRVEQIWDERLRTLTRDHDKQLRVLFPHGVPDACYLEFEVMSGQDTVYKAFHTLLKVLHNTAPDYPNKTRD